MLEGWTEGREGGKEEGERREEEGREKRERREGGRKGAIVFTEGERTWKKSGEIQGMMLCRLFPGRGGEAHLHLPLGESAGGFYIGKY